MGSRGRRSTLSPLVILAIGVVFLLAELDIGSWGIGRLWPVILVILGLAVVLRAGTRGRRRWRSLIGRRNVSNSKGGRERTRARGTDDSEVKAIFGGAEERVTSQEFEYLQVTAIFGGVELDLTGAKIAGDRATVEVTVLFGGVQLRVPPGWRVKVEMTPLLGGVENKHRQPAPGEATGELVVTGTVAFGGITLED